MSIKGKLIIGLIGFSVWMGVEADEFKTLAIGNAEVVYDFQPLEKGSATLTITASITENNDLYRNKKNKDSRRLSKLGQLIYQCKIMLYQPVQVEMVSSPDTPILISSNYSLLTNVNFQLNTNDSVGINVYTLDVIDEKSLFTPTLGNSRHKNFFRDRIKIESVTNIERLNLDIFSKYNILKNAESVYIDIRFPIFQLNKTVNEWGYSFNVLDFKKAIQHTNENCSQKNIMNLMNPPVE